MSDLILTSSSPAGRFYQLIRNYGLPFWKSFIFLIAINLIIVVVTSFNTLVAASVLKVFTGSETVSAAEAASINAGNISLVNVGTLIYQWTGLDGISNKFEQICVLAAAAFASALLGQLLGTATKIIGAWIGIRAGRNIQFDLFKHLLTLSMAFFNKRSSGELISRIEADANGSVQELRAVINIMITSPILLIFYTIITVRASPVLFFAVVTAVVLNYLISICLAKPIERVTRKGLNITARIRVLMQEVLTSIRVVKSFCAERHEMDRFRGMQHEANRISIRGHALSLSQGPVRLIANQSVLTCVLLFTAYEFFNGTIELDTALLFIFIFPQIVLPIKALGQMHISVKQMITSSEKVHELFSVAAKVRNGTYESSEVQSSIQFKDVSFSYREEDQVLKDVNVSFPVGKTTAIVGPSGAGKSTMVDLLLRFYDPTQGAVLMDGKDLRDFVQQSYRRNFGIVSQESLLFNTNLRDNITYGRDGLSESDVENAIEISNAREFIDEMPERLETMVGDRGVRLSGGQRQRIAIARAVVGRPSVLVLDEATSALDSHSEKVVQQAIERVTENTTAIIIAHRLSTVMHADNILVMEAGEVIDQGTHNELVERCDLYKNLCKLQFNTNQTTND
ncbi:MAG: ABC transporter ATP-binding protein [Verrucomicrobiota bacterium]